MCQLFAMGILETALVLMVLPDSFFPAATWAVAHKRLQLSANSRPPDAVCDPLSALSNTLMASMNRSQ